MPALAGSTLRLAKRLTLIFIFLFLSISVPKNALAETFSVAPEDTPGLITAINQANSNSGSDEINLASVSTYELTTVNNDTYSKNGLPVVTSDITINGNGSIILRNSTEKFRILALVNPGILTLNDITIENGYDADALPPDPRDDYGGGGVFNLNGVLIINDSKISNNRAEVGGGGGIWLGGGSTATIVGTKITNNQTNPNDGSGGGLLKRGLGLIEIINSEISNNYAFNNGGALYIGNDLLSGTGGGLIRLDNSKISNNSARNYGGAIFNFSGETEITNNHINSKSKKINGG